MATDVPAASASKGTLWTGRVISALIVLFLFANGAFGLTQSLEVKKGMVHLGYPETAGLGICLAMLASALIYAIPQTSVLGAILLTGYLGGATASHIRIGELPQLPVTVAALAWFALFLREPRLRALVPLRR